MACPARQQLIMTGVLTPATGHTDLMLRAATWLVRGIAFVVIGVLTFSQPSAGAQLLPLHLAAYVLIGVMMAGWALLETGRVPESARQRWLPVTLGVMAAVGGLAGTLPNGGGMIAFAAMATLGAGSDSGLLAGWVVTGVGVLGIEAAGLAAGTSTGDLLGYPLLLIVGLLAGHNRRSYRIRAEQSAAMLAQVEQLQAEQRRADVLDERTRIAREIHDVLAHSLGALGIQIQAARAVLTDTRDVDRAIGMLATAQRMATGGLTETRRAVQALRTDALPLDEELAQLAETHGRRHNAVVSLKIEGEPRPLPPDAALALLRTAQEALVNAAKHAPHQPVDAYVEYTGHHVRMEITNPLTGQGSTNQAELRTLDGGYGLTGMRERLLLLGGTLTAGPEDGRWVVTAEVSGSVPR
jgi:signal transduction histidine kinase